MSQVRSKDGTTIAYEQSGKGPALILVDGALCSRAFGPSPKLAPLLARHFTVYAYDRRGRGQSGDTQPYSPWIWRKLEAVAHTLPYDAAVMTAFRIPRARFASIGVPALVINGAKTDPRLREAAQTIVNVIPTAHHRELPGQTHNVKPDVLTPAVVEFFTAPTATTSRRA